MTQTETRKKLIDILAEVSQETGVEVADLIGPKRRALFVQARSFFAQRARAAGYAFVDIGEALGRSHSTVMEYFTQDETQDQGGTADMDKEQAKAHVRKFNKADRKVVVAAIAETADKEERDDLATFFSGVEVEQPAPVETPAARRETPGQVPPEPAKKKSVWDDL